MERIRFTLMLTPAQVQEYYRGAVRRVSVRTDDGRWLELPANHLRRFVARGGIRGRFELELDDEGKLVYLKRIIPIGSEA